ncbi:RNA pyrophosphohydrolase [Candidiatus Paracoxiella cheracis]
MIDEQGYRLNVGIVVVNQHGELLWGRRVGNPNAWQFPQGGISSDETPREAMYRELTEELGLNPEDVEYLGETKKWLSYRLPKQFRRYNSKPLCVGQKQKWFLLRLLVSDSHINLDKSGTPEFDHWRWVDYWYPLNHVIDFKQTVYQKMLKEFEKLVRN